MGKYTDDQVRTAIDVLEHTSGDCGNDFTTRQAACAVLNDYLQPDEQPTSTATALQSALQLQDGGEHFVLASIAELFRLLADVEDIFSAAGLGNAVVAIRHFGLGDPLEPGRTTEGNYLQFAIGWCDQIINDLGQGCVNDVGVPIAPQFQIPLWHDRKLALIHLLERCAGKTYTNNGAAA